MSNIPNFVEQPFFDFHRFSKLLSRTSIEIHFEEHHKMYQKNLENLYCGPLLTLEQIIKSQDLSIPKSLKIYNNAAQIYNHNLFWRSFNLSYEAKQKLMFVYDEFLEKSNSAFGSSWTWLIEKDGTLQVVNTKDAKIPDGEHIMVLDLWEHAYYIQYHANRKQFITNFLEAVLN